MAETRAAPAMAAAAADAEERRKAVVVVVGVDDSDHSYRALEWAVRHVAAAAAEGAELVVVHGKPSASSVVTFGSPAAAGDVVRIVEADLRKRAEDVVDRARSLCVANSVTATTPFAHHTLHCCNLYCCFEIAGALSDRGDRRGGEARPLQRRREARRGSAHRRQPRLRRNQEGFSWERERLLCPPRALLRDDREAAKAQDMMPAVPIPLLNRRIL